MAKRGVKKSSRKKSSSRKPVAKKKSVGSKKSSVKRSSGSKRSSSRKSSPKKSSTKRSSNSNKIMVRSSKRKLRLVTNKLVMFGFLFLISLILMNLFTGIFFRNLFSAFAMIFGFVSVAFLIVLLVLLFMRLLRK